MLGFFPLIRICDRTGDDFLHNLPDELEEILENKNTLIPDANLLTTSNIDPSSIISSNSSIWHNSISEKSSTEISNIYNRIGKIGVDNISSYQSRSRQVSTSQINFPKTVIRQFGVSQVSSFKINSADTSFYQISFSQVGTSQINILQPTSIYSSLAQVGAAKVNSNDIYTLHESSTQIDSSENDNPQSFFGIVPQIHPSEITFSSSVSSEEFNKKSS